MNYICTILNSDLCDLYNSNNNNYKKKPLQLLHFNFNFIALRIYLMSWMANISHKTESMPNINKILHIHSDIFWFPTITYNNSYKIFYE